MGRSRLLLLTVLVAVVLAGTGGYFYLFCKQQKLLLETAASRIDAQQSVIEAVEKDIQAVRALAKGAAANQEENLRLIEAEIRESKSLLPEMKDTIEKMKAAISQSRADAFAIKEDAKQWQKDYVSVLIELEERLNAADSSLKSFQEKFPDGSLNKIQQEVDDLKNSMKKFSEQLSSVDSALVTPLPRFDSNSKK